MDQLLACCAPRDGKLLLLEQVPCKKTLSDHDPMRSKQRYGSEAIQKYSATLKDKTESCAENGSVKREQNVSLPITRLEDFLDAICTHLFSIRNFRFYVQTHISSSTSYIDYCKPIGISAWSNTLRLRNLHCE